MVMWEVLLPTASQNCAKPAHYFPLNVCDNSDIYYQIAPFFKSHIKIHPDSKPGKKKIYDSAISAV